MPKSTTTSSHIGYAHKARTWIATVPDISALHKSAQVFSEHVLQYRVVRPMVGLTQASSHFITGRDPICETNPSSCS